MPIGIDSLPVFKSNFYFFSKNSSQFYVFILLSRKHVRRIMNYLMCIYGIRYDFLLFLIAKFLQRERVVQNVVFDRWASVHVCLIVEKAHGSPPPSSPTSWRQPVWWSLVGVLLLPLLLSILHVQGNWKRYMCGLLPSLTVLWTGREGTPPLPTSASPLILFF